MLGWLLIPVLAYLGIVAAMFFLQRSLLYHPETDWQPLSNFPQLRGEEQWLTSNDGTKVMSWWLPGREGFPVIVYFHGNAGNLNDRVDKYTAYQQAGFSLLALSYRGYGPSEGSPTEVGLYADADAAIAKAQALSGDPTDAMLIYGESLGTGVAVEMATRHPIKGLVLEAPFSSVFSRGAELYPWLPVSLLMQDRFDSLAKINRINTPLLIFHNEGDTVIPIHQARQLYAAASEPKRAHWLNGAGHVEFDWNFVADQIQQFHLPQTFSAP